MLTAMMSTSATATHDGCLSGSVDWDSDGLPTPCDPSPTSADADFDGYKDSEELYVGTNPLNACLFPPDVNNDNQVKLADVLAFIPPLNTHPDDALYNARFDWNGDEAVSLNDLLQIIPYFNQWCGTPYTYVPHDTIVTLEETTRHSGVAQVWSSNNAGLSFQSSPSYPTSCGELGTAGAHWTNTTDFTYSLAVAPDGTCLNVVSSVVVHWGSLPCGTLCRAGETFPWTSIGGTACTDSSPCHFAGFAEVVLSHVHPSMVSDAGLRHTTLVHELGHVLGQGHAGGSAGCSEPPHTIMKDTLDCALLWGVHWPRPNDVLFTNAKY
jgi:hypothetical protein